MNQEICYVCGTQDFSMKIPHKEFKDCLIKVCPYCEHAFCVTEDDYSSASYNTNIKRADRNLKILTSDIAKANSILEIGPSKDFYFLNQAKKINPKLKIFYLDNCDLSKYHPKDFVRLPNDKFITGFKYDLCYLSHSLEHIQAVRTILSRLLNNCKRVVIDVPSNNTETYQSLEKGTKKSTGFHYHFFSYNSLRLLLLTSGFNIIYYEEYNNDVTEPYQHKNLFAVVERRNDV